MGAGADVNQADKDGTTALMVAPKKGHRDVVELLVGAGADVNRADKDGTTAPMSASKKGHRDVVEALVGGGGRRGGRTGGGRGLTRLNVSEQGPDLLSGARRVKPTDVDTHTDRRPLILSITMPRSPTQVRGCSPVL